MNCDFLDEAKRCGSKQCDELLSACLVADQDSSICQLLEDLAFRRMGGGGLLTALYTLRKPGEFTIPCAVYG